MHVLVVFVTYSPSVYCVCSVVVTANIHEDKISQQELLEQVTRKRTIKYIGS
jgi:hypothetical protein